MRKLTLLSVLFALALGVGASSASAAPAWKLDIHHNQTNFPPGGTAQFWFNLKNIGDAGTSGPITLEIELPSGLSRDEVYSELFNFAPDPKITWSCPGVAGQHTITCTTPGTVPRHALEYLIVQANVTASSGTRAITATLSGGGAPDAPLAAGCAAGVGACAAETVPISAAPPGFGILADSFTPEFTTADEITPLRQAGSHPALFTVPVDFNSIDTGQYYNPDGPVIKRADENLRDLTVELPLGFVGDPTAIGECSAALLALNDCPPNSQVGRFDGSVFPPAASVYNISDGVYNMVHPRGVVNDLAFIVNGNPVHVRVSLDPARNYAVLTKLVAVNESAPAYNGTITTWGYPRDPAHDYERCSGGSRIETEVACSSDGPAKPFLTLPAGCGGQMTMRARDYDSWQNPGVFGPPIENTLPDPIEGCEAVPFAPTVSLAPTTNLTDSPAGLDIQIELPQDDDPTHIATSPLKDATVALPEGLTVNPAAANGLDACTPAQISLGTDDPVRCPQASKVADGQVTTVLPDPVKATIYLATPHDNPFGTLLAGYIVFSEPDRGVLVKVPGRIDVDPATGRLTGTFKDNPQLPFSELQLHFKGGAHSSLITPKTCGDYTSSSELSGWAGNPPTEGTDSFTIAGAPSGGGCPAAEGDLPNSPSLDAGPVSPISKNYNPFVLHLRRSDGTQRFGAFNVTLPQGLTGKLAGTALCPDGALAAAAAKTGKDEQANPSCPLDSRVGAVHAAAGAGPDPYNVPGVAYLAGPYKGAPVSLAVITPAVAGPFDLGTIVIRTPLRVDPKTAQITALSDPIPQMLEGIPTDVRSVNVIMDRPEFTLTGTSCDPASIDGMLTSTLNQNAPLSVRYQLSDCGRLPFKPKIKLSLKGKTRRGGHPALTVVLQPRPQDANIASLSLAMPRSEFLENAHIRTICTRPDFAADNCPGGAIYGEATVQTALLDYPLSGHVYLRSSDNLLPDLVPDLRGPSYQPIKVESAGRTDSIRGGIRNTFDFVPDAPFTKLVTKLPGGNKGLLVNSRDICRRAYRATVKYTAHNNATYVDHPKLRVKCKGRKGKKRKGKRHGHRRGKRGAKSSALARRSAVK